MSGVATMRAMIELGLSDEQKLILIEAIEADAGPSRSAAERQRRYRQRQKEGNVTDDVTRYHNGDASLSPSLNKESPQTPKKLNPTPCVRPTRETGYHRLPEGWTPTRPLPPKTHAKADQWPPGALIDELAGLHRWALNAKNEAGKGRKKNWDTAWVNWIERRHDEHYGRSTNGMGRHKSGDGEARIIAAGARFVARGAVDQGP